ncbi:MAG: acetyl/propionyl/methylcrotonyl-CoA carboxylase subunit alpha [Gemmatimonadota bacterium]
MFRTVLVANRGEIALRVIRTLRELGVRSVAVYSDPDVDSPHVEAADEAVRLGPAPARDSYLDAARVLEAAHATGAEAIHPGYGFLSENATFARRCAEAGVVFVGPSPQALEATGDKARARETAASLGVPTVPASAPSGDLKALARVARELEPPYLVKAAAGGGGKGMRLVRSTEGLPEALASAAREARAAFGDATLLVERYVHPARHVEVQVLGDGGGGVAALGERECSLQRRYQKIVEEAPSAALEEDTRTAMLDAARRLAGSVRYAGAGTVEFLLAADGSFFFLEMNARLQVEHPVTELVTGLDLVRLQLEIACGEVSDLPALEVPARGHAIEARLYAEDPTAGFLPSSGTIGLLRWPQGPGVRVDAGIQQGQRVGTDYDPLLAKLVAWAPDREHARRRLVRALEETALLGLVTNQGFLLELLESDPFRSGRTFTHTVEGSADQPGMAAHAGASAMPVELALAGGALALRMGASAPSGPATGDAGAGFEVDGASVRRESSPWRTLGSWRLGGA